MVRIYYYPESGKIHSAVTITKARGSKSPSALVVMGLEFLDLSPEQELRYHANWSRLHIERGELIGHDEGMFAGREVSRGEVCRVRRSESLRILMISSWQVACGIAEYTKTLVQYLKQVRPEVEIKVITPEEMVAGGDWEASLIHVQYEPNLYDREALAQFLEAQTVPVVLSAHYYDNWVSNRYLPHLAQVITHNPDLPQDEKHTSLVQGCPVAEEGSSVALRKRYTLPLEMRILTSFGFIMPWKQIDYFFCGYLAPMLQKEPDIFLQLLHARYPKFPGLADRTIENIQDAIRDFGLADRVEARFDFLSLEEANERIQASDLGYAWGRAESRGSSATTKAFVAGRCPLVVPISPHYADLTTGMVKVPDGSPTMFVETIRRVIHDSDRLCLLREEQRENYARYNYREVANQHWRAYACLSQ